MNPPDDFVRAIEAVLFAAEAPMTIDQLRAHAGEGDVRAALAEIEAEYAGRGIGLVRRGDRWHFEPAPDRAHLLRRDREEPRRLSRAAIETLAIIAYHEPVTRAEIEAIRCPLLAVQGLDDEYGTLEQIHGIARRVPQTELLELSDCGHSPHRDQADRLIATACAFIKQKTGDTP